MVCSGNGKSTCQASVRAYANCMLQSALRQFEDLRVFVNPVACMQCHMWPHLTAMFKGLHMQQRHATHLNLQFVGNFYGSP